MSQVGATVLDIRGLTVAYGAAAPVVRNVDLTVHAGEIVGLIGESGSGKSTVAMSSLALLDRSATVRADCLEVCGEDLAGQSRSGLARLRGRGAAMVFQDAMGALDPTMRVGTQIAEVIRRHRGLKRAAARKRAVELLAQVGVPEPDLRARQFPFALSGGLRQRAAIAIALAGEPKLLFADEPTTALDVTVQAGVLDLFRSIRDELGVGIVLISHDIGVIAQCADQVSVMLDGEIVERGAASTVLSNPQSDYTRKLLAAAPTLDGPMSEPQEREQILVSVRGVARRYAARGRTITALDDVSLDIRRGEVLGIVGESGSGKSTLAKLLVRLEQPSSGQICFEGQNVGSLSGRQLRAFRHRAQMVFQHPAGSLDPRMTVSASVAEPLTIIRSTSGARAQRVARVLDEVGLGDDYGGRLPHALSGGQKQRVGIARSIVGEADFVVLDEPTSALDVSVQAQVLDLLAELQRRHDLTMVLISHNLAVVRAVSDRVAVMRAGRIVEMGETAQIFHAPEHPYTRELLAAVPSTDPMQSPQARSQLTASR